MFVHPLFLASLIPPEETPFLPRRGQRARWPGDDRDWVWDGERWVGTRTEFHGGDMWDEPATPESDTRPR
jgi:hypothetical protein